MEARSTGLAMMRLNSLLLLGGMGLFPLCVSAVPYADKVVDYTPGVGAATKYQTPDRALGEPSRVTSFAGTDSEVTPFNPAWTTDQLVSVGKGGSITLHLGEAARDSVANPFGVDFIVYGNNGFIVSDFTLPESQWSTDGSLFNFDPPGKTRVWVSENNVDYFELVAPAGASSTIDGHFPIDGSGSFFQPIHPNQALGAFEGLTLSGIREVYAGSAGGTGFDLAWARLLDGSSAGLTSAGYVRIEVLEGKVEIDGLSVVPEPGMFGFAALGGGLLLSWRRRSSIASA